MAHGILLLAALFSQADDVAAARHERMAALAKSYTVYVDGNRDTQAELLVEPIFRWANPERESIAGEVYLWTHNGRPHATIGIWTYDDTQDSHELQSLAQAPFFAAGTLYRDWQPSKPSLDFQVVDGERPIGGTPVSQLVQLRRIAQRRFAATIRTDTNSKQQLRLLPQPLYRYDPLPDGVLDGAMFSFASGTDPEVFLLLEVRESAGERSVQYAFGSSTSIRADGFYDGRPVWNNDAQHADGNFVMYNRR